MINTSYRQQRIVYYIFFITICNGGISFVYCIFNNVRDSAENFYKAYPTLIFSTATGCKISAYASINYYHLTTPLD